MILAVRHRAMYDTLEKFEEHLESLIWGDLRE